MHQPVPLHSGANVTLIAALTPAALGAAMTVSGAVNGRIFAAYLQRVLGPTLPPGDVVVLDNLAALFARLQPHRTRLQQAQNQTA